MPRPSKDERGVSIGDPLVLIVVLDSSKAFDSIHADFINRHQQIDSSFRGLKDLIQHAQRDVVSDKKRRKKTASIGG